MKSIFLFLLLLILDVYLMKCFEEIVISISLDEEQENGKEIIDLEKQISSLSKLGERRISNETYKIRFVRTCEYFEVKQMKMFVRKRIDREELCRYEKECFIHCDLLFEKEEMKLIKIQVKIQDINDHQARFQKKFYQFNITDETNEIELEEAEDEDLFQKNIYYLNSSSSIEMKETLSWKLVYNKDKHLLKLMKMNSLKENKYLLELYVEDELNEKDFCLIEINLIRNDLFQSDLYLYKFEITNLNSNFIGKIHSNISHSTYRLISSSYENLFELNSQTGEISLNSNSNLNLFDKYYELYIESFHSLSSISLLIKVEISFNLTRNELKNDFIEILIPKLFQRNNSNEIYLKENVTTIPLTLLQLFTSSSSQPQMNSSIHSNYFYFKQSQSESQSEDDQQSFELILLKPFDYEIYQQISLHFFISNFIQKSIEIYIENINDCLPQFNQTIYSFHINENNYFPFILYTFQAFDQDQLNNLTYSLQFNDHDDNNFFFINSTNGDLWILNSFDREIKSNYSLFICAFDGLYETCSQFFLQILDENDNICSFNSSHIHLTIQENLPSNTFLIQINAFDQDSDENSLLYYNFSSSTSYLTINSINGIIQTTSHSFDYELFQNYSIRIYACDHFYSSPSFCCSIQLIIHLIDLNDNLPFLIYPSSTKDLFLINYTNQTMPQLKATDNDIEHKHREIFFQIIGGTLNSSIHIDYYSGQLSLLPPPPRLPLYGTLILSLSSQTILQLTLLIYDNQTDLSSFLTSLQQSSFFYSSLPFVLLGLLFFFFILSFYLFKRRKQNHHHCDGLMNTPSTTTLSTRSISTSNQKRIYDTYYSFGDSVSPDTIHL